MTAYIIRRVLLIIPTIFIVSMTIFVVLRLIPGSAIDALVSEMGGTMTSQSDVSMRAEISHRLGLDVPIHVQYVRWVKGILLHGDLGLSLWREGSITKEIANRIPVTFELGMIAMVIGLLISFPVGIYSAIRQDTVGDYIGRSFAIACIAVPAFWLGTMVIVFPSIWWNWMPPVEYTPFSKAPLENMAQVIIPGVILGMGNCGVNMRMIRATMLEVLRQDYVRTAWSKGLRERVVVLRHVVSNAILPVITLIGLQLPVLISGAVILERIFLLPGMGRLLVDSAMRRDYNTICGVTLVTTVAIVFINLIVDLLYAYLDPRVRYT